MVAESNAKVLSWMSMNNGLLPPLEQQDLAMFTEQPVSMSREQPVPVNFHEQPVSYPEAVHHFMTQEPVSIYSHKVSVSLPPARGRFHQLLCIGPPEHKRKLREEQLLCLGPPEHKRKLREEQLLCLGPPEHKRKLREEQLLCLGPPEHKRKLREEQIRLLCLSHVAFNDEAPMHLRLLNAVVSAFSGASFSSEDPAADFRSCGILGLVHLYYLHYHNTPNAELVYRLSRSADQELPMSTVSTSISKWTLQV
eukprot:gene26146-11869_t